MYLNKINLASQAFRTTFCGYMKFLRNAVEQKFGWSEAEPYSRCCAMCLGGGLHTVMLLDTCAFFTLKKLARLLARSHGRRRATVILLLQLYILLFFQKELIVRYAPVYITTLKKRL